MAVWLERNLVGIASRSLGITDEACRDLLVTKYSGTPDDRDFSAKTPDHHVSIFASDCLHASESGLVRLGPLVRAYDNWCANRGIEPLPMRALGSALRDLPISHEVFVSPVAANALIGIKLNRVAVDRESANRKRRAADTHSMDVN
jgi:hypothetical protein